jgi:hypothetical protein
MAEHLFELQMPRVAELLGLVGVNLGQDACFANLGGGGNDIDDPDTGKLLAKCVTTVEKTAARYAGKRFKGILKCIDAVYACIQTKPLDPRCRARAALTCNREFARLEIEAAKLPPAVDKRCGALDFAMLQESAGANLDAIADTCSEVGITSLTSLGSYEQCILRQHICSVEELLRFASPRVADLLALVGHAASSSFCPAAP